MHRCYHPDADWRELTQVIEGDEAKHALKVMRMRVGDECEIFDGKGQSALCHISAVQGSSWMSTEIDEMQSSEAWDALPSITLALAIPKGSNMDLIVQKAVELGVGRIIPLMSERTIVRLSDKEGASKRKKWERTVLEACKQSGVSLLPEVEEAQSLASFLQRGDLPEHKLCCAIVPHARAMRELMEEARVRGGRSMLILIGPEGDFSPKEYEAIEAAGYGAMSLGPIILRVETAVFMAVSAARYALG
ncbi:MAG: RsmE family RNA methyltransferase [Akkermansia sp.]